MSRRPVSPATLVAVASLWMAAVGNVPLWRRLFELGAVQGIAGAGFALAMLVIMWASLAGILSCLAWPRVLKPVLALLLVVTAVAGYFMLAYGVIMDPGMLTNVVQTDPREAYDLLSWQALAVVAGVGVLPAVVLARQPLAFAPLPRQLLRNALVLGAALVLLVVVIFASFQPLAALMRSHKDVRYLLNPLASLYSLGRVASKPWQDNGGTLVAVGTDASVPAPVAAPTGPPAVLLLVLGETARSDHFAVNGYGRPTTPRLAQEDVVSFRNAWSCGTSTAASVPCMFSHLARAEFGATKGRHEGLLDVLQRAGLAVLWIDNQAGCKGVCDRVPSVSTTATSGSAKCAIGECLDEVMLEGLDERIAGLDPQRVRRGVVLVMHQMGSHGPAYHLRSPAGSKPFQPECTTSALNECTREAVVNAYDNSIRYTDHFLGEAIDWLKGKGPRAATALMYVSDHGESLGEANLYLHGMPYLIAPDAQKHVPWVTWLSEGFQRDRRLSPQCLRQAQDARISHDNYFHSVLGLMNVQTTVYRAEMDVYAGCRAKAEGQGVPAVPAASARALRPPVLATSDDPVVRGAQ